MGRLRTQGSNILSSLVLAGVLLTTQAAWADFYRYVDKFGVVHITNTPTSAEYKWMMDEGRRDGPDAPYGTRSVTAGELDNIIYRSAARYGIDPTLVKAIVKAESDFDVAAVSGAGARGLMQLMPETARLMGVRDIHDPADNVEGGTRYLSHLLKRFDWQVELAVAAYNAGETAVSKYGSVPPFPETEAFVKKVLYFYRVYGGSR